METADTKHHELRHSIIQSFISRSWPLWLAFSCILAIFFSAAFVLKKKVSDSLLFSVCYFSLFHCPQEAFAHWCVPWHLIFLMNRIDLKTFPSSFWKVQQYYFIRARFKCQSPRAMFLSCVFSFYVSLKQWLCIALRRRMHEV